MMGISIIKDQKILVDTFSKAKNKKDLTKLINDLFTEEEILDLAQRLKIAQLILQDKTYEEISDKAKVSTSTISKIGQVIKFGKGGFKLVQSKTKSGKK